MSHDPMTHGRRPRLPLKEAVERARLLARRETPKKLSAAAMLRATAAIVAAASFGMAGLAAGDTLNLGQVAPKSDIDIRVGRNKSSGRIEIYGAIGSRASVRKVDGQVVIRLPGQQTPDIGDIRANPPVGITKVDLKTDPRATELWLKVADGYDTHFGREDGAVYVQVDPAAQPKTDANSLSVTLQDILKKPGSAGASASSQAAPVPVVALDVADQDGGREISFPFAGPVASAVFRRGDSVWIVFDTEVDLRLPPDLKDGNIITDAQWVHNDGFTAVRVKAPSAGSLSVVNEGLVWRVRIGGQAFNAKPAVVAITRDDSTGVPSLSLNLAGATRIAWIRDPEVGDRMAIVTARGPAKNLPGARTMVEASLDSTAQGVVVTHMAPDVKVSLDGDLIQIERPGGLNLSSAGATLQLDDSRLDYKPAQYPSLVNPAWSEAPQEGFLARYTALQVRAADEAQGGPGAPTKARLALARFLVGQQLNFEAQGALDMLVKQSPRALEDPQVRGLRVAAMMMAGRYAMAAGDLSSGALSGDLAARLWTGYAEVKAGHYADAVKDFAAGGRAMDAFPAEWRARLATAYAYAAMQRKDMKTAGAMIAYATAQDVPPLAKLAAYLVDAQIIEAQGDRERALKVYQACARASDDSIAAPAMMHATMLSFQLGKLPADKTLAALDALRFRWRGDGTELQIVNGMGQIYLSLGRYRDALTVLKSGQSFDDSPLALQIQQTQSTMFRNLFLGGMADGLQPVEALALFNDFKELTPIGADGDEMVRRMARRLVDVDLLDQAAGLLDHQVNERLDGVAKSSVAADLAAIYLMDHDPQKALQTLWNTRTTLLPKSIMSERRVLEARALNELGEPDKALDALGGDTSTDADDVRADIFWRQSDWAKAAAILERQLGDRYKTDAPLSQMDESRLIRAGVAYSLLKDQASLTRMSDRWGKFAETASSPDAVRVALAPLDGGTISARDFALTAAQTDSFAGWVAGMKKRFREKDDAAAKAVNAPPAKST